jgi:CelD/BcsL family acetyltransferase involved in cellulose biosynthesis
MAGQGRVENDRTMTPQVLREIRELEAVAQEWDELSVDAGAPFTSPKWLIPWWRHAAPSGASLCVIVVRGDGGVVVGVAPLFSEKDAVGLRKARFLGAGASLYVEPVARAGMEEAVAAAIAQVLVAHQPRVDYMTFEGTYADSPWRSLIADAWPGGSCWWHAPLTMPAPFIDTSARSHEEWFASKSKNFREQTRRRRRQLEKKGATFRVTSDPEELDKDLEAFVALHHARWDPKGGSAVLSDGVRTMLPPAGKALLPDGRFRLWSIDVEGRVISSHLFIEAGGRSAYWLGGFDPEWSAQQPALQTLVAAIEDGWGKGDRLVDLGAGGQDYKYRLADDDRLVVWGVLVFPSRRWLVRARLGPYHLKRAVLNRLPDNVKDRVKSLLRRGN